MTDPYRRMAGWYDRVFEPMNRALRSIGLKLYPPQEGIAVLDVGCGTGSHLKLYQEAGCKVYGIDLSESMLALAKEKLNKNAQLHLGSATEMPYTDGFFDLVISMFVLHEMDQQIRSAVLSEMNRVTKDKGRMLLIDYHFERTSLIKGGVMGLFMHLIEMTARGEHYKNFRHFKSIKGLPALIQEQGLVVKEQKIVTGGNLALYLLSKSS